MNALRSALVLLACAAAPALAGCSSKSGPPANEVASSGSSASRPGDASDANCELVENGYGSAGTAPISVDVVARGLEVPWGLAFLPNGEMLVTERPGRIRVVTKSGELTAPVASPAIARGAEGGLLGLALHPRFSENRQLYVYLTAEKDGRRENRIERYTLDAGMRTASFDKVIFSGIAAAQYHDGGRLRFGPDGMLYAGTGDAREPSRSRDPASPNGKILRLDPEGGVPADNPLPNNPAFLLGARNVEAFDFIDAATLVVADHGPSGEYQGRSGHDEISIAHRGDDLGWPDIYSCETHDRWVTPSLVWAEAVPPGGASIYRGTSIPEWKDAFVVGTLKSEHLGVVHFDANGRVKSHEVYLAGKDGYGRLRDVVMGPDGQLYVATSNCDGRGRCGPDKDRILRIRGGS